MARSLKIASLAAASLLVASAAVANPLYCAGTITAVYMSSDGSVVIEGSWRSDYTQICNDQGTFGGIDATTCLSWFALAVKAQTGSTPVTLYYPNAGAYTCTNPPTYTSAPSAALLHDYTNTCLPVQPR